MDKLIQQAEREYRENLDWPSLARWGNLLRRSRLIYNKKSLTDFYHSHLGEIFADFVIQNPYVIVSETHLTQLLNKAPFIVGFYYINNKMSYRYDDLVGLPVRFPYKQSIHVNSVDRINSSDSPEIEYEYVTGMFGRYSAEPKAHLWFDGKFDSNFTVADDPKFDLVKRLAKLYEV